MKYIFQYGGEEDSSSDFFNRVLDMYSQSLSQSQQDDEEEIVDLEPVEEDDDSAGDTQYQELLTKYNDLENRFNELSTRSLEPKFEDDSFLNFLFSDDDKLPINWDALPDAPNMSSSRYSNYAPQQTTGTSFNEAIASREGNYSSVSPNSSGTGKYQFLWGTHGNDIKRVTGVRSREEFLHSPKAQEEFFSHWDKTTLEPEADKVLPKLREYFPNITKDQAKMMIHFGGAGNVQKAIKTGQFDKPLDANGMSLKKYVFRQTGGFASTPEEQHEGLNNPAYNSMYFPTEGTNTFRGLDNGTPVYLQDETGKATVLHGPHDTTQMNGQVWEQKMQTGGYANKPIYQVWNDSNNEKSAFDPQKIWLNQWIRHPEFAKRLAKNLEDANSKQNWASKVIPFSFSHGWGDDYYEGKAKDLQHDAQNKVATTKVIYSENPDKYDKLLSDASRDKYDYYTSIMTRGVYSPLKHTAFFNPNYLHPSTPVHEFTHATGLDHLMRPLIPTPKRVTEGLEKFKASDPKYKNMKLEPQFFGGYKLSDGKITKDIDTNFFPVDSDEMEYLYKSDEIYPRIMQLRYEQKLKPGQPVDLKMIKKMREESNGNQIFDIHTDEEVMWMLNNLAKTNQSTKSPIAIYGGKTKYKFNG